MGLCLYAALASLGATGCGGKSDPVLALVESIRASAEDRDAAAVAAHLAPGFRGPAGADKDEVAATLRRYLAGYETVRGTVYDVTVTRRTEAEADVSLRAEFNGAARRIGGLDGFLPPSAVERFRLHLARTGAEWRVASAEWEPIEATASARP